MDEDEVLGKITRLLEQGCTMLATHHDCGAPLFRCQGKVVCPVCSFIDEPSSPAKIEPSASSRRHEDERPNLHRAHLPERKEEKSLFAGSGDAQEGGLGQDDDEMSSATGTLRAALLLRLRDLTTAMQDEQDLDKLKKLLDCLEGLLRVMRSMQE
ncbi:MAG: hypothetical protein LUQ59_01570 [Methanothrix sp.]|nr:hypothetical protein [Methanothrix sp.]